MQAISSRATRTTTALHSSSASGRAGERLTQSRSALSGSRPRLDTYASLRPATHLTGGARSGARLGSLRTVDAARIGRFRTRVAPPGVEDLSARLSTLLMGEPTGRADEQTSYIAEVAAAGTTLGFRVACEIDPYTDEARLREDILAQAPANPGREAVSGNLDFVRRRSSGYVWAEDNKWFASDGTLVLIPQISQDALTLAQAFVNADIGLGIEDTGYATEGVHTAGLPRNDPSGALMERAFQGAVNYYGVAADGPAEPGTRITRTYNEGGNMLVGRGADDEPYAIVGRDGLLISAFHLASLPLERVPELAPEKVSERALTLSASPTELEHTAARLEQAGASAPGSDEANPGERALSFLAQLDITKDILAADIGIPRERIAFVPQPDFHVDMHMRPLGPGQVLIEDPDANIRLINKALEIHQARARRSESWERQELLSMLDNAERPKRALAPVLDEIQRQVESIGLTAVRAPGVMEGVMGNGGRRLVNFMNAVPGTTSDGTPFYMTNYSSLGSLRRAYEEHMLSYGIPKVVWIGQQGGGTATSLSASERSLLNLGGLDCRENHSGTSLTVLLPSSDT